MDIGINKNLIPMVTEYILRIQRGIGINKILIPMVTESIMRIHMGTKYITSYDI